MRGKSYRLRALLFGVFATLVVFTTSFAAVDASVWVNGYTRNDGTYVQGHYRSNPDGNPYNNWSYPGNTNPYTGEVATGDPATYLQDYYGSPGTTGSTGGSYATDPSYGGSALQYVDGGYYYGSMLFCNSGYYESGAACLKAPAHATAFGGTSFYCDFGYYRAGEHCRDLPANAYATYDGSWACSSGYLKQGDQCVAPENGWLLGSWLYCKTGYVASNSQCISHTQDCQLSYGDHVLGRAHVGGGSSCSCEPGYTWNHTQTACVQNAPITSGSTDISAAELQKQINALLATIAALQAQLAALSAGSPTL